ncbi:transcription initiation protein [Spirosoma aureum]|uniref:Transcription initiation protein n=1 Tax=Spirosoma aureum TaxID=2692134 RepID=A0A6G9ARW2_9BACT|nr:YciI family protein [Spirosoma aureum]QIP15025.1 transcription initiation protein [Spirosoma aureum]
MNEFVLIFRRDYTLKEVQPTGEAQSTLRKHWQDWFLSLAALNKLTRPVQRWDMQGVVLNQDETVTDGPYLESNSSVIGLIFISAHDYREAEEIAKNAPILEVDGTVEIRMLT